jgi:hypothetical protein
MELKPSHQRLLDTSAVPQELAAELAAFCAGRDEIAEAFLCEIERTVEGEQPTRSLSLGVDLVWPVSEPEDSRGVSLTLATALPPELMRRVGVAVLADRAVPAWRTRGRQIYARNDEGRP